MNRGTDRETGNIQEVRCKIEDSDSEEEVNRKLRSRVVVVDSRNQHGRNRDVETTIKKRESRNYHRGKRKKAGKRCDKLVVKRKANLIAKRSPIRFISSFSPPNWLPAYHSMKARLKRHAGKKSKLLKETGRVSMHVYLI